MSESIPEGWTYEPLGRFVADSAAGEWGKESVGDENDIPVLRSTNFTNSGVIDYTKLAVRNIDEKKRVKKALKYGDIVLEKSGGSPSQPVGRVIYFEKKTPFLFSNFTQKLSPTNDCDSKYLFFTLYYAYQSRVVLKFQQQTTGIINFQLAEYLKYKTAFAPIPEQQKIASILTSVDSIIEKTESQIGKLQDLKKGMMQELLTKGIGHTEFKDSPVGRIPKEWEVVLLDSVTVRGSGHTPSKSHPEYWNGGIKWVSLSDSSKLDNLYISRTDKEISKQGLANSSAILHPEGTVILSRDAGIGKSAILANEMAVSQHFMVWICGEKLDRYYLYYLLQHWKSRFEAIAIGSTIKTIGLPYFKKLQIPLPEVDEQKIIAQVLLSTDKRIFAVEHKLHHIQKLKKSLMQDLLTGKVRVKPD